MTWPAFAMQVPPEAQARPVQVVSSRLLNPCFEQLIHLPPLCALETQAPGPLPCVCLIVLDTSREAFAA